MFHKQRLNRNKYQTMNSGISQSGDDMIAGMLSLFEAPRCVWRPVFDNIDINVHHFYFGEVMRHEMPFLHGLSIDF